ncbi:MAG: hypothetical protein JWO22_2265 [Frankiales bacterium]|nr:hypothetical protein [Frankiales bacterium]
MPGLTPMVTDERHALKTFLDQCRLQLRLTAYGLTDDQARQAPTASSISVGGAIKHVTFTEGTWTNMVEGRPRDGQEAFMAAWTMTGDDTLEQLLAGYDAATARTDAVLADRDLDELVPVPQGVPWFPQDLDAWSVRWIVMHLIQETARHSGHADIVREQVDGATAFPLMAAAEGWPETPWMKPWSPGA